MINQLKKWDDEKMGKYSTDYLEGFNKGIESLKSLFVHSRTYSKVWYEARKLNYRIKREIERRNNNGENI